MSTGVNFREYVSKWYEKRYASLPRQFYCQVHILRACQYNCVHCYFHEIPKGTTPKLSLAQTKDILNKVRDSALKHDLLPRVDFTGGDPLLHPDFFAIAEYSVSQGIPFGIKGNPDLLEGGVLEQLRELGIRETSLSLDGLEPFQDGMRGMGSFQKTIQAIGRLKEKGFVVRVHSTISKYNASQLIQIFRFLYSNEFVIDDLTWSRYWSVTDPADMLTRKQVRTVFQELVAFYEEVFSDPRFYFRNTEGKLVPRIRVGFKEHLWFPYLLQGGYIDDEIGRKIMLHPNSINCTATQHVYIIDPDGSVYKCRKIQASTIGNILTQSFEDILQSEKSQIYVNLRDYSTCGKCPFFNGCAGCSAVAEAKRKSQQAGDPDCFIEGTPSSVLGESDFSTWLESKDIPASRSSFSPERR